MPTVITKKKKLRITFSNQPRPVLTRRRRSRVTVYNYDAALHQARSRRSGPPPQSDPATWNRRSRQAAQIDHGDCGLPGDCIDFDAQGSSAAPQHTRPNHTSRANCARQTVCRSAKKSGDQPNAPAAGTQGAPPPDSDAHKATGNAPAEVVQPQGASGKEDKKAETPNENEGPDVKQDADR